MKKTDAAEILENAAAKLFGSGLTYQQIADTLGVSRSTVSGLIMRHRQRKPSEPDPSTVWTGEQLSKLKKMHGEGATITQISIATGKSYEAVRQAGRRQGLDWSNNAAKPNVPRISAPTNAQAADVESKHRAADRRFQRKLAEAIYRGDHVPAGQAKPVRPLVLQG